jgi:hypothetical protein
VNEVENLKARMREFAAMLDECAQGDDEVNMLRLQLRPLFAEIEKGSIRPPCVGRFKVPFLIEDERYGLGTPMFEAAAQFACALDDSASQPWFKAAFGKRPSSFD